MANYLGFRVFKSVVWRDSGWETGHHDPDGVHSTNTAPSRMCHGYIQTAVDPEFENLQD